MWSLDLVNKKTAIDVEQKTAAACSSVMEQSTNDCCSETMELVPVQRIPKTDAVSDDTGNAGHCSELLRIPPNYVGMRD